MLLDSNIIIYAARPEHESLRRFIADTPVAVSAVSLVEVLGYHRLTAVEREQFERFFSAARLLDLTREVLGHAVTLRQSRKMTLGDALVAATALTHDLTLVTHNRADFDWIPGLRLLDPLEANV
jgi:predicted nucleic acid-binding protein